MTGSTGGGETGGGAEGAHGSSGAAAVGTSAIDGDGAGASAAPHASQNRSPGIVWCPHAGQIEPATGIAGAGAIMVGASTLNGDAPALAGGAAAVRAVPHSSQNA
ncbi:MAG: hypothetical protein NZM94_02195 [Roseiflexus sp.]|nr:hypothetical protein [Roseiflexus sp.]